jgi:hypothetical protein
MVCRQQPGGKTHMAETNREVLNPAFLIGFELQGVTQTLQPFQRAVLHRCELRSFAPIVSDGSETT